MFSSLKEVVSVGKDTHSSQVQVMIQSFLKERAAQKLVPERDSEIDRITHLIQQLKATKKELKNRRESLAYRKMKTKQR